MNNRYVGGDISAFLVSNQEITLHTTSTILCEIMETDYIFDAKSEVVQSNDKF